MTETSVVPSTRRTPPWPSAPSWLPTAAVVAVIGIVAILIWGLAIKNTTDGLAFDVWLNRQNSPVFDALGLFAAEIVSPALAVCIGILFAALAAWRSRSVAVGLGAGLAVGLSWASSDIIKLIVHRARPEWLVITHHVGVMEVDPSFPSGHVTFVASLTVVLVLLLRGHRYQWLAWVGGTIATLLVALSRLYVGAHYPSDVIAAALYGLFGGVAAFAFIGWVLTRTSLGTRLDASVSRLLTHRPFTRRKEAR